MSDIETALAAAAKPTTLPELRSRLYEEMPDRPYQVMAVYQRHRNRGQRGEYWPDKPESVPATSRYPNILAEFDASAHWIDRVACAALVSMEIMAAAMEDNGELKRDEIERLSRYFACKLNYLLSPVLSMVDPSTHKGRGRLRYLRNLVQQTEGMDRFFYRVDSSYILPMLESGKPVTYATYRWACKRLQDVLDTQERKKALQRQIRTAEHPAMEDSNDIRAKRVARLQEVREQAQVRAVRARLDAMRQYASNPESGDRVAGFLTGQALFDLLEYAERDMAGALILAARYGCAAGYQAAQQACTKSVCLPVGEKVL